MRIPLAARATPLACLCVALTAPTAVREHTSPNGHVVAASEMAVARASHTSTLLPDGRVLVTGGFAGSGSEGAPFASSELFTPSTGRFTSGPPMRVARVGHTATSLPNGSVLVLGGWTGSFAATAAAERYDPATSAFVDAGAMAAPRADQTATLLADGRVLVTGGTDPQMTALATAELYDPAAGRFTPTGPLAHARFSHTATRLADGRVLIVGGGSGRRADKVLHAEAELYDPATGRFTAAGTLGTPRHKHAATLLADGSVLVVGGSDLRDGRGQLTSVERWRPARGGTAGGAPIRGTFAPAAPLRGARFKLGPAVAALADGRVVVAGGAPTVEIYDAATGVFHTVDGSLGAARYFSAASRLRDGSVLVTGGYADSRSGPESTRRTFIVHP